MTVASETGSLERGAGRERVDPARTAFTVLHWAFATLPVVVGVDKFLHLLTNWNGYLAPSLARRSPLPVPLLMRITGVMEIVVGIIVALRPAIGAWLVTAWLAAIVFDLCLAGGFLDIALRDVILALAAIALAMLARSRVVTARP
jgi:hypothetical protein